MKGKNKTVNGVECIKAPEPRTYKNRYGKMKVISSFAFIILRKADFHPKILVSNLKSTIRFSHKRIELFFFRCCKKREVFFPSTFDGT